MRNSNSATQQPNRYAILGEDNEWLETDGLGGFAMGTVGGVRTRRYHGLLIAPAEPGNPAARSMLVNGLEAWGESPSGPFSLVPQHYTPDVRTRAQCSIESFTTQPWPTWTYRLDDGTRIEHELFLRHGSSLVVMTWRLLESRAGVRLRVRPLVSTRDYHSLHRENTAFRFTSSAMHDVRMWQPYEHLPAIAVRNNGKYHNDPQWYRNFLYVEERERGFDCVEDLASPGVCEFDLSDEPAILIMASGDEGVQRLQLGGTAAHCHHVHRQSELVRRAAFESPMHFAADQYLVTRGNGKSIIAGYPWFADWGRDTFIALRGLCIAAGQLDVARDVLLTWASTLSQGMLPNRFTDGSVGEKPEYNSVDASLWFVITAYEFLQRADRQQVELAALDRETLRRAILDVVASYAQGTRYGIKLDQRDWLLAEGEKGQQLTWMDARVEGREITPRIGKPVEVQALWLNTLWIASQFSDRWKAPYLRGRNSFRERFWNDRDQCLFDVVDDNHEVGQVDATIRPNQILAVGGLPMPLIEGERAKLIVRRVESDLLTPLGLRTLPRNHPKYAPRYEGGPSKRDAAYHQGTVWPWLVGPFVEAWLRVNGLTERAKREARKRFIDPLMQQLSMAGLGHVSEIADGAEPHTPRGCPFQAWSLGELLRVNSLCDSMVSTTEVKVVQPKVRAMTHEIAA